MTNLNRLPILILALVGLQQCAGSKLKGSRPDAQLQSNTEVQGKRQLYKVIGPKTSDRTEEEALFFNEGARKGGPPEEPPVGRVSSFEELEALFNGEKVEPVGYENTLDRTPSNSVEDTEPLVQTTKEFETEEHGDLFEGYDAEKDETEQLDDDETSGKLPELVIKIERNMLWS